MLGKDGWEYFEGILHHQGLPYVPGIIRTELISRPLRIEKTQELVARKHHDDPLVGHFGIEKTRELGAQEVLLGDTPTRR